jgi:hypothetical protein
MIFACRIIIMTLFQLYLFLAFVLSVFMAPSLCNAMKRLPLLLATPMDIVKRAQFMVFQWLQQRGNPVVPISKLEVLCDRDEVARHIPKSKKIPSSSRHPAKSATLWEPCQSRCSNTHVHLSTLRFCAPCLLLLTLFAFWYKLRHHGLLLRPRPPPMMQLGI